MPGSQTSADSRPHVVLGVSGGIAAYKACELLRRFTESGHDVTVVPTEAALRFVGTATWEALSGKPVASSVFDDVLSVRHVRVGQQADLVVVAPATADLLAKAANGQAGDLLTATLLTARCPVVLAPAMHTEMWEHPATRTNVETLRSRGVVVLEPANGRLTGADTGPGRLPEPAEIFACCADILHRGDAAATLDLTGRRVVVSAGGTREHLDPVRYLGNSSSGKQGYALAATAAARGAEVTVVAANVDLPEPAGVKVVHVISTRDLASAVQEAAHEVDAVVMAAAPADFRPEERRAHKIKKRSDRAAPELSLVETEDLLAGLVTLRGASSLPVLVGFAAETGDAEASVLDHARAKLRRKGCDLLVVNDVGGGAVFGDDDNQVVIIGTDAADVPVPPGSKRDVAHAVWDQVVLRWGS
ncbi:MAG: bifunctional phosphopantothenoylcysteine decarboxylase/phosphopantothenate--cysteine ligase CoaBC [Nocardioidaceae bacterium]|nr:bifunctional phosphopantothenoylcysteine decarboxylase/phosphopantothenate--cysteine ligase CoaBC [Nocardioidaceae bacterium]